MLCILECAGRFVKLGGDECGDVWIDKFLIVLDETVMDEFGAPYDARINLFANEVVED